MLPPTNKWEYKVCPGGTTIKDLNKLGEQGWELVLVINKEGYPYRCILKRMLPPSPVEEV